MQEVAHSKWGWTFFSLPAARYILLAAFCLFLFARFSFLVSFCLLLLAIFYLFFFYRYFCLLLFTRNYLLIVPFFWSLHLKHVYKTPEVSSEWFEISNHFEKIFRWQSWCDQSWDLKRLSKIVPFHGFRKCCGIGCFFNNNSNVHAH